MSKQLVISTATESFPPEQTKEMDMFKVGKVDNFVNYAFLCIALKLSLEGRLWTSVSEVG